MSGSRADTGSGFTLVELMVVVLVLGILVTLAVPIFNAATATARQRTCFANQRVLEGAAQTYCAETGTLPHAGVVDASEELIVAGYIVRPPVCPVSRQLYALDDSGTVTSASLTCGHTHC